MRICEVQLTNIKSYVDDTIRFSDGVTFVAGLNGAGKSTILEAVGVCLFDWKPSRNYLDYLVRRGEKSGKIRVRILAEDGRLYDVERRVGSSADTTITDVESNWPLDTLGARDVQEALRKLLGIDPDWTPSDLFSQVVSVEQSSFTTPFLIPAASRKKLFDPIFKVEAYREAFGRSTPGLRALEARLVAVETDIARCETRLEPYDDIVAELETDTSVSGELTEQETDLTDRERAADAEVRDLASKKEQLQHLKERIADLKSAMHTISEDLASAETAIQRAQAAQTVCDEFAPVEERYSTLGERIADLQRQLTGRQKAVARLSELEKRVSSLASAIETGQTTLTHDRKETARLLEENDRTLAESASACTAAQAQLTEAKARLDGQQERGKQVRTVTSWVQKLDAATDHVNGKRQAAEDGIGQLERLNRDAEKIEELAPVAGQVDEARETCETLRTRQAELEQRRRDLEDYRTIAAGNTCPFFHTECPVVEGGFEAYFAAELAPVQNELERIREQIIAADARLAQAREARETVRDLAAGLNERGRVQARLSEGYSNIIRTLQKWHTLCPAELTEAADILTDTPPEEMTLPDDADLTDVNTWRRAVERISAYRDVWAGWNEKLVRETESRTENARQLHMKTSTSATRAESVQNDAQRRRTELLDTRANLDRRETQIAQQKTELIETETEATEAQKAVAAYDALENDRVQAAEEKTGLEDRHAKFIAARSEAAGLQEHRERRDMLQTRREQNERESVKTQDAVKTLEQQNLPERLAGAERNLDNLRRELSEVRARLGVVKERLERNRERKAQLDEVQVRLASFTAQKRRLERGIELFGAMRSVLRSAADRIADTYRVSISQEANRIHRRIARDSAELVWGTDYEIALRETVDGREQERTFRQLSGGEQMTAALAVRLALMRQCSGLGLGMFDEPTTNLDEQRRMNLAQALPQVAGEGFGQLIVISHDDTFDALSEQVIRLEKTREGTRTASAG